MPISKSDCRIPWRSLIKLSRSASTKIDQVKNIHVCIDEISTKNQIYTKNIECDRYKETGL